MTGWIVLAALVAVLLYFVMAYNRLVRLRTQVDAGWSQIDVQLRRRYDLVPNLVESVKAYMAHEQGVLEAVTRARAEAMGAGGDVATRSAAEGRLGAALSGLMLRAEAYPELKAAGNVLALQEELASTENRIAFARQHFNDCVMEYNTRIASVPDVLLAGPLGFRGRAMFEAGETERAAPRVQIQAGR